MYYDMMVQNYHAEFMCSLYSYAKLCAAVLQVQHGRNGNSQSYNAELVCRNAGAELPGNSVHRYCSYVQRYCRCSMVSIYNDRTWSVLS